MLFRSAGAPTVEEEKLRRAHGELRESDEMMNANDDESAVGFLPNLFAEKRALQIRKDA